MSEAFGVSPDYFFRETAVELGEIEFRKLKKLPSKEEHRILEHARDYLSRYIELEQILVVEKMKRERSAPQAKVIRLNPLSSQLHQKAGIDPDKSDLQAYEDLFS